MWRQNFKSSLVFPGLVPNFNGTAEKRKNLKIGQKSTNLIFFFPSFQIRMGLQLSSLIIFAAILISFLFTRYISSPMTLSSTISKAPVWFVAHGGPPTLFEVESPPHQHWLKLAKDFKQSNLKGIIFVSAHWQAEREDFNNAAPKQSPKSVLMNTNTSYPLIYDFYNFPAHYYQTKFYSSNSKELQDDVASQLRGQGYHVQGIDRGIDHGVWVPLRASGEQFDIPLLQVSLPISKDPLYDGVAALRLGRALRGLRDKGYSIIGGGQPVHNLRDYMMDKQVIPIKGGSYGKAFSDALTQALVKSGNNELNKEGDPKKWDDAKALFMRPDYLRAHPTSEHLLPALVALGAAEESEEGVEEFKSSDTPSPLMWNMYRIG